MVLYARSVRFGFVDYDDTDYVVDNSHVASGLKLVNLVWAFRDSYAANWHPLTWLSHMLDCQLFGPMPGPPHVVNALLHAANSVLVFIVLFRMTGFPWRSWITAALFAFHPLHVESVAWIAERKDVLSTLFFLLCILSYARFAEIRADNCEMRSSRRDRYLLALTSFACGLLSKPMLVSLPFVLLLLDYWPLQRLGVVPAKFQSSTPQPSLLNVQQVSLRKLLLEKIPFFALAAASSLVTFSVQRSGGAVASLESTPFAERVSNAAVSYWHYLGKMFWPRTLFIPYVPELDQSAVVPWLAGAGLVIGTVLALVMARRWRYVPVGWFWYLGTLAPVIGILKVGSQTMADRYTYIPSIGIFILLTSSCAEFFHSWRIPRAITASISAGLLVVCLTLCVRQIGYWKNGETLFLHSLRCDPTNLVALSCLASGYATDPDPHLRDGAKAVRMARICVEQTRRGEPGYLDILSTAYAETGQFQLALEAAEEALRLPATAAQPLFQLDVKAHIELYKAGRAVRLR